MSKLDAQTVYMIYVLSVKLTFNKLQLKIKKGVDSSLIKIENDSEHVTCT
jgi:hypothetical protein